MNNQASEIPRNWDSWGLQCKEGILQSTISTVTVMLSYSERKKARTKITRQFFRLDKSLFPSERTSLFLLSIWHVQSVNCRRITKPITLHLNQWIYGHLHIDIKPMFVLATCFPFATCHKRVFFLFWSLQQNLAAMARNTRRRSKKTASSTIHGELMDSFLKKDWLRFLQLKRE